MEHVNSDVAGVIASFLPLADVLAVRLTCQRLAAAFLNPRTRITVDAGHTMTISRHNDTLIICSGIVAVNGVEMFSFASGPVYRVGRFAGVHVLLAADSYRFYRLEHILKRLVGAAHKEFPVLRPKKISTTVGVSQVVFDSLKHCAECHTDINKLYCILVSGVTAVIDETTADALIDGGFYVHVPPYGPYFYGRGQK